MPARTNTQQTGANISRHGNEVCFNLILYGTALSVILFVYFCFRLYDFVCPYFCICDRFILFLYFDIFHNSTNIRAIRF